MTGQGASARRVSRGGAGPGAGGRRLRGTGPLLVLVAVGVAAALLAAAVIRPLGPTTIDPDAAASVLYFDRLIRGHRLEAFVPTTPKPLLTIVYGLAHSLAGDWRALTGLTLVLFGTAVPLALAWTWRTIRPAASAAAAACGAALVAAALVSSSDLVLEVSRANSLIWALVGWLVAGLAMSTADRRPVVAGSALLVAGLARVETLLIVGGAAVALAVVVVGARAVGGPRSATSDGGRSAGRLVRDLATVVVLGALAVPIACLHDLLLTGDPWYWTSVPARYTELYAPSVAAVAPLDYLRILAARFRPEWPLLLLGAVGGAWLVARRRWVAVTGLGSLGLGSVALLTLLAVRGTYISARYYEPLDLVLLSLASAGPAAAMAGVALARSRYQTSRRVRAGGANEPSRPGHRPDGGPLAISTATLVGLVIGVAATWPAAPVDRSVASSLELVRASSAALETYMGRLGALAGPAILPADVAPRAPVADPAGVRLFVPSLLRPRIAVETGRPLTALGDTYATFLASPPWVGLHAGQRLYHDAAADRPDALDRALGADPALLGQAVARPELVDPGSGVRILLVESP